MSQNQTQGLGGLSYKSTNDLSGTVSDVTNGNPVGSLYKNAVGLFAIPDTANACSFVVAGANAKTIGVICDTPKAGQPGQIQTVGSAKVFTGGVVAVGDLIQTDSNGRGITASGAAQIIVGRAMEAASAAGQLIEVVLFASYVA